MFHLSATIAKEGLAVSMDLFRRKQKIIFWIVTIIIVPSFVLVWGVSGTYGQRPGHSSFEVGRVGTESVGYQDFDAFRKRLQAAVGGLPFQFAGAPGAGTPSEELWKYLFTYAVLKDAEKADTRVSELQVGTYIDNFHPITAMVDKKDPKAVERAVDNLCRQMQISRAEFIRGVREWQTIGNYLISDSNLATVSADTIYTFYALNRAECVVKRVRIMENDSLKEEAKRAVMEKPAADLEKEIRAYIDSKTADQRYRDPSGWRFAYVLTPFVAEASVHQPTAEEIQAQYDSGRATRYAGKSLDDVRDQIKAELVRQEVERQTLRNLTVDVDPQLRGQGSSLPLAELAKLAQLVKYGVIAGETGAETLAISDAIAKLPAGAPFELRTILEGIDAEPAQVRDALIKEWKDGFNLSLRPFPSDVGFFRLHLLDYKPSVPAVVDTPEGTIKPGIYEMALVDMVGDRVASLTSEKAKEMESRLRSLMEAREKGAEPPDPEMAAELAQLPEEVIPYTQIDNANYALGRLQVGDMTEPTPYIDPATGAKGMEVTVLVERRLPTRESFEQEPEEVRARFRQLALSNYRGNYGFTYTMRGPAAVIQPSPTIMAGLVDRFYKSEITVNPELIRSNANNEG